jgi:endonuclease YncB( thermonuclease family)
MSVVARMSYGGLGRHAARARCALVLSNSQRGIEDTSKSNDDPYIARDLVSAALDLIRFLGALMAVGIAPILSAASAGDLIGQATIIDGDTLEIHGTRVRILGIDAPESGQLCRNEDSSLFRCGQKASNELDAFIALRPVKCIDIDERSFRRTVAVCTVAGFDIADWLVRHGFALDWPKYSKGGYAATQVEATRGQLGMWGGSFVEPWKYRACRRAGGTPIGCSDP